MELVIFQGRRHCGVQLNQICTIELNPIQAERRACWVVFVKTNGYIQKHTTTENVFLTSTVNFFWSSPHRDWMRYNIRDVKVLIPFGRRWGNSGRTLKFLTASHTSVQLVTNWLRRKLPSTLVRNDRKSRTQPRKRNVVCCKRNERAYHKVAAQMDNTPMSNLGAVCGMWRTNCLESQHLVHKRISSWYHFSLLVETILLALVLMVPTGTHERKTGICRHIAHSHG